MAHNSILIGEFIVLFGSLPVSLYIHPTLLNVPICLYVVAAYAALVLHRMPDFSWKQAWYGRALTAQNYKVIALRFTLSTIAIIVLTKFVLPERLFAFPLQKLGIWLLVMLLCPVLSALPQELIFRTFFFRRYAPLFPRPWMLAGANTLAFGFMHIVFHNPISPVLSVIGGLFFASSYGKHKSLRQVSIEHGLYGNMVFTAGLGLYFIVTH